MPRIPVVANPPPPGVYSGPRLAVFVHLLDGEGTWVAGNDGLWVDPVTLLPGDRFLQVHPLELSAQGPAGPYSLEVGLYDPLTEVRWAVMGEKGQPLTDRVLLSIEEGGS